MDRNKHQNMEQSGPEHVVESFDEVIRVGAEELGMDETELRARIDAMSFVPTGTGRGTDQPVSTVEQDD